MNTIQKALLKQDIHVAWAGDEPDNVNRITKIYIHGEVAKGRPRMIRTSIDTGKVVVIKQLKEDYTIIKALEEESSRINSIKRYADTLILSEFSNTEHNAMVSTYIVLSEKANPTKAEKSLLSKIQDDLLWVSDVYSTANTAKYNKTVITKIKWPKKP